MTALIKHPKQPAQVIELPDDQHERMEQIQKLVGGWFELVRLSPQLGALVNEDGRMLGMKYNLFGLVGPIVFVGIGEDEFVDLPQDEPLLLEVI